MLKNFFKYMSNDIESNFQNYSDIFKTYDEIKRFNLDKPREFIASLDAYLLHAIEECVEYGSVEGCTDFSELVDIFNYVSTIGYILYTINDEKLDINLITSNFIIKYLNNINIYEMIFRIIECLINIRRLFPHRKWHKKSTKVMTAKDINIAKKYVLEAIHIIALVACYMQAKDPSISDDELFKVSLVKKSENITTTKDLKR